MAQTNDNITNKRPETIEVRLLDAKFRNGSPIGTMPREIAACFALTYASELSAPLDKAELASAIPGALAVAASFRSGAQRKRCYIKCAELLGVEAVRGDESEEVFMRGLLSQIRLALIGDSIEWCPSVELAGFLEQNPRTAEQLLAERQRTQAELDSYRRDYEETRAKHEADLIRSQQRSGELRGDARDFSREPWKSFAARWSKRSRVVFGTHPDTSGVYPSVKRECSARLAVLDMALDRAFRSGDVPDVVRETRRELAEARGRLVELEERRREVSRLFFQSDDQEQKLDQARAAVRLAEAEVDRLLSRLRHELAWLLAA